MASFVTEFKHLEIQLEDIVSATNNFDESKVIGRGGFGKVYAGELSHSQSGEKSLVAIKRLDRRYGQGDPEFFKEIRMLSCYRHENLISLLGFCCQGGEMILIYEYASRGSLDRLLSSAALTWTQRLRICLDAAKGLSFLHDPNGTQQRVLHCDIKSANILLDMNMTAKVSDFGLSKMGPASQQYSLLITNPVGTPGYCDPLYMETYSLTKESDVYSFGVVLFEVLTGKPCVEYSKGQLKVIHVPTWKQSYGENKLNEIIMQDLMQQMDPSSLKTFSDIAFQCLRKAREERPTMSRVVEELEIALESQEFPDLRLELLTKYEDILMAVDPLLIYKTGKQLKELLSKGLIIDEGKTWLSLNDKGENHVMISIEDFLILDDPKKYTKWSKEKSRFSVGCYKTRLMEFKLRVTAPLFLSPDVTYGLNLVLHASEIERMKQQYVGVGYKLKGETKFSIMHFADKKEGKQLVAELYQFNSTEESILDLEIFLEHCGLSGDFYIEGIEFRPSEKMEHQVLKEEDSKVLLSQGVFLNRGKRWLSINEKGEHIERIYIEACVESYMRPADLDSDIVNSRFPGGLCYHYYWSSFKARVRGQYLTPQISYTLNLVFRYKYQSDVNSYNRPLRYKIDGEDETKVSIIYPSYMREDGWFIVPLYHFTSQHKTVDLQFEFQYPSTYHLLVAGIEFQPSEEKVQLPSFEEYRCIIEAASQSLFYTSLQELKQILSKGVHLNGYNTWFSINEKGEHCHMISMKDCLIPNEDSTPPYRSDPSSRFPAGFYLTNNKGFKTHVKTQFLSPSITYTVNLVFYSSLDRKQEYGKLKYRLRGETTTSTVNLANRREFDYRLWIVELFQFNSDGSIVDLEIDFDNHETNLQIEGILFQPLEKWLSINEKGEHIVRISIEACLNLSAEIEEDSLQHPSDDDIVNSRFPGGRCYDYWSSFKARVRAEYLTPHISYTLNLVFRYKYESRVNWFNPLRYKIDGEDETKVFIIYPTTHMRGNGWFIVPLYHFTSQHKTADLQFEFEFRGVTLLVAGFEFQPSEEKVELPVFEEYQYIIEAASQSLFYRSLQELKQILSIGVLLNGYKTWFSINEKGEHCHMISMKDCLIPNEDSTARYRSHAESRFPAGLYQTTNKGFKTHVKTQLLSPSITYTVNLVYGSYSIDEQVYVDLKYRLRGETTTSVVYLANRRQDDLLHMAELFQFTGDGSIVDLEIDFDYHGSNLQVEGILFQPLEKVEDQVSKDDKAENIQTISESESDTYWEQKLPNDYEEILNLSIDSLRWTTKKELYPILRRGFLIDNGQQWFSVDKHGKKCLMLSAKATWVIDDKNSAFESSHESRFGEVLVVTAGDKFELVNEIKPEVLLADTTYASYFVYKLPQDQSTFEDPLKVKNENREAWFVYLVSPPGTPIIKPKFDENSYNPLNRHKLNALPRQRSDGWMEVKVWQFYNRMTPETVSMHLKLEHPVKKDLSGLIIHGIELRPI